VATFKERQNLKWIMVVIAFLGTALGAYFSVQTFYDLMKASFDRTTLSAKLADKLGRFRVADISTDEMMLISYAYDE
jgi:disulfide bond formation protein DsbB